MNKILQNIFPEIKFKNDDNVKPVSFPPIFETSKSLNQASDFVQSGVRNHPDNFLMSTKYDERKQTYSLRAKGHKPNRFNIFNHFGSVSELKDVLKDDPTYITRVNGLHNLRQTTRPVGRSLKSVLKKVFSRYKRAANEDDNLILKRPAIFENTRDDIRSSNKAENTKFKVPQQNTLTIYYKESNKSDDSQSPTMPSIFYEVPPSTPSSFYEVPPPHNNPDTSLHPASIVQ